MLNSTDIFILKRNGAQRSHKESIRYCKRMQNKGGGHVQNTKWRGERQEGVLLGLAHVSTPAITALIGMQEDGNPEV